MNFADKLDRVQRYAAPRLRRLLRNLLRWHDDPRKRRGRRHKFASMLHALVAGLLSNSASLRDVEALSERLGLGRRKGRISDTALGKLTELLDPERLGQALVEQVRDMRHRGELVPDGLPVGVATVDGKNLATLQHHGGGAGHMRTAPDEKSCWWIMPALRSVLTSAAGRVALGQWMQPPGHGETTEFPRFFAWLVETYGRSGLIEVFDVDAGFTSRANFALVDEAGYGVVMGLKGNQPELHEFAKAALAKLVVSQAPEADTPWEVADGKRIRRQMWRTATADGYLGWKNLRQIWLVRQTTTDKDGATLGVEDRYFITNLTWARLKPTEIVTLVRRHWGIENDCFNSLDVQWREDSKPWWTEGNAVPALGVLRLMAYNIAQALRKRHLRVRVGKRWDPTPWRDIFELLKATLIELARLAALPTATAAPP